MYRLASQAGLWYNTDRNIVRSSSAANTLDREMKHWRFHLMDSLSLLAQNDNTLLDLKPIPLYPGYYADCDGNIYSAWKTGKQAVIDSKKIRKMHPVTGTKGYRFLSLKVDTVKGKYYRTGVHRLVCLAFYGIPPQGYTASHLNGNREDNRLINLAWESYSDNFNRKKEHGTHDGGCQNSRAKIDEKTLKEIRILLQESNLTHKQIGEKFGLSRAFISKIKSGYRYKSA